MIKKNIGNLFAETLIGKQFRFPGCGSNEIYTVESVQFGGYDTDIDDSDPGVEVHCFCKPIDPKQPKSIPVLMFGLEDEIELIEQIDTEKEFQNDYEFNPAL